MTQDLRFAVRSLLRAPGFTAVAMLTLALGIGANTAIFSVVNAVLLRPLTYEDPDRLVAIFEDERSPTSPGNFLAWKEESRHFETMTAAHPWSPVLRGWDRPDQLQGLKATPALFDLLGAAAERGRTFLETQSLDEDRVVVLGHELWQRRFGGDVDLVGRTLSLDGEDYTVIGIMPPGFAFPPFWATEAELWVPLTFDAETRHDHGSRFLRVFARLRQGSDLEQGRAEIETLTRRLVAAHPEANDGMTVRVESLREPVVSDIRGALVVLLGAVALVLAIACANVANLFLVRSSARRREIAVRAALGAGRASLVRQLLTESTVLALAAGGLGLLLGLWGVEALVTLGPENVPRLAEINLDLRVFLFTLATSLVTGAVFGLFPVANVLRWDLNDSLRQGSRQLGGRRSGRLRSALVVAEIALALMLLAGAGLLLQSLARLVTLDPGFRSDKVLTLGLSLAGSAHAPAERQNPFFEQLLDEVRAVPGVEGAAMINHLPIGGDIWGVNFQIEGQLAPSLSESPKGTLRTVSPGFFAAMDVPLLAGRVFDSRDREDSQPVVIVSQALAERYWGGDSPVGRRIRRGGPDSEQAWMTVAGVVGDVRQWQLADEVQPGLYFPYRQNPVSWYDSTTLVVNTPGEPKAVRGALEERIWRLAPEVPLSNVRTMAEILSRAVWRQRFNASLLALFAALALALAAIGIYGVMSYAVSRRRSEIGVRMALGAGRRQILRLIVRQGMGLTVLGVAIGLAGALALARFLGSLLFGVGAHDLPTFLAVSAVLALVAFLASYLPALRASRLDPLVSLRDE